ncbi:hypothetical protein Tco_1437640 [Tanacetum coccineum]
MSSLPTEQKELPTKFNELAEDVKGLKNQVHELEIELLGELKEIPTKLEDFTKTVTSLTSQVAKLKTLQWELPAEFLPLPTQVFNTASKKAGDTSVPSTVQAGIIPAGDKTSHVAGSLAGSSKKKKLRKFDFVTESGDHVHLTEEQINAQKKIKEEAKAEAAKQEGEIRRVELVDLLGPKVVSKYYNAKKGPITLKVYREDGTSEIIHDFKASDLHLGEWREVVKACPNRTGKGWKTIYERIQTRMDYLHQTKEELGIDLDKPLKQTKGSSHQQDFVTIEDFRDFPNKIMSTIQNFFFRLHQGPEIVDHARTFSSFLLAEVDKRNLNPLKQMRVIEQLRR